MSMACSVSMAGAGSAGARAPTASRCVAGQLDSDAAGGGCRPSADDSISLSHRGRASGDASVDAIAAGSAMSKEPQTMMAKARLSKQRAATRARSSPLSPGFVAGFGCAGGSTFRATALSSGWSHVAVIASPSSCGADACRDAPAAYCPTHPAPCSVFTWGRGDMGQLGRPLPPGTRFDAAPAPVALPHKGYSCSHRPSTPTPVESAGGCGEELLPLTLEPAAATSVACGSEHTLAAASGCGCLWSWGWNEHGNCGLGGLGAAQCSASSDASSDAAAGSAISAVAEAESISIVPVATQVPGFGCHRHWWCSRCSRCSRCRKPGQLEGLREAAQSGSGTGPWSSAPALSELSACAPLPPQEAPAAPAAGISVEDGIPLPVSGSEPFNLRGFAAHRVVCGGATSFVLAT